MSENKTVSTTPLGANARASIAQDLAAPKFMQLILELLADENKLAGELYNLMYSPAEQQLMHTLPVNWLHRSSSIYVRGRTANGGRGQHTYLQFGGSVSDIWQRVSDALWKMSSFPGRTEHIEAYCSTPDIQNRIDAFMNKDSELGRRIEIHINKRMELINQAQQTGTTIRRNLAMYRTVESLCKAWPEVETVARKYINPISTDGIPRFYAPVPALAAVNALLELPREVEIAG